MDRQSSSRLYACCDALFIKVARDQLNYVTLRMTSCLDLVRFDRPWPYLHQCSLVHLHQQRQVHCPARPSSSRSLLSPCVSRSQAALSRDESSRASHTAEHVIDLHYCPAVELLQVASTHLKRSLQFLFADVTSVHQTPRKMHRSSCSVVSCLRWKEPPNLSPTASFEKCHLPISKSSWGNR